ncbi:MAG: ParB/RepB/Spo0J family partition protein [Hyphomicrobium sp.]|nr:ParB/RepB/Spo0J family partition protein [Hyphomicrobium sp.]
MTDTITIPLNRLAPWDGNVRRTGITDGIDELAASITAHGLLQSLVVRKGKRSKYEVVAGQRRYLALTALAKAGTITKDHPVPCMLAHDSVDATELSLAENVVRAPMHPADQFEAFRALIDDGASVADVAARFGITETVVAKRLKLGRLSPVILDAYRNGDIGLDAAQAFAVTDDREAQERVFTELASWNRDSYAIRRALTAEEIPTSDKRVRFVGVDAYTEAGGVIRQDLFSEDGTGYLQDAILLDRLVTEKLTTIAAEVRAEGWRWVEVIPRC